MQTTDIVIYFTTGLSGSVAWPWPIAVYLFLAGISGVAVALAIIINLYKGTHADNPQIKLPPWWASSPSFWVWCA